MAKRLSSYERNRRQWEKDAERRRRQSEKDYERNRRQREKDAERRWKQSEKEAEKELKIFKINKGKTSASLFDNLVENLTNLVQLTDDAKSTSEVDSLATFEGITYPGDLKFVPLGMQARAKDFLYHAQMPKIQSGPRVTYEEYKAYYGSFFRNILGKTRMAYYEFLDEEKAKYEFLFSAINTVLSHKDQQRKEEFEQKLAEYKQTVDDFNKQSMELLVDVNHARREQFGRFEKAVQLYNERLTSLHERIETIGSPEFIEFFGKDLPIQFMEHDKIASNLQRLVGELEKNFYNSPSKNLQYGIEQNQENNLTLILKMDAAYFPLPSEQQVKAVAKGYSVVALAKKSKVDISTNLLPSAALTYLSYAFNTCHWLDTIYMYIGLDTHDAASGKGMVEWTNYVEVTRNEFEELNLERIVPSKTIQLFSKKTKSAPISITWFDAQANLDTEGEVEALINEQIRLKKERHTYKYKFFKNLDNLETVTKKLAEVKALANASNNAESDANSINNSVITQLAKHLMNLDSEEARAFTHMVSTSVKKTVPAFEAQQLKKVLEASGAKVELRSSDAENNS